VTTRPPLRSTAADGGGPLPLLHPSLADPPCGDRRALIRRWPSFLGAADCADLIAGVDPERTWRHRVMDPHQPGGRLDRAIRNAKSADTSLVRRSIRDVMRRAAQAKIQPAFGLAIEWIEQPQLLVYETGGHYAPHPDTGPGWLPGLRDADRDVSVILYLNDAFDGGTLLFPELGFELRPRPGLLVAFPSDARFLHGALPVTRGLRFAVVTWMKAAGTVQSAPPAPGFAP
jgi:predicted 2-oxoglutarate/Fe(II)-dependent dioxygenase YbiX